MRYLNVPLEVCRDRTSREGVQFFSDRRLMANEIGERHIGCTLDSYQFNADNRERVQKQKTLVKSLKDYSADIRGSVQKGRSILLFGRCGTGKDHLLYSLSNIAWESGLGVKWVNGPKLFGGWKDSFGEGVSEDEVVEPYVNCDVLWLSDPIVPGTKLSSGALSFFYRIVDERYRHSLPTWMSVNAINGEDLEQRLGMAILDRFSQGGITFFMDWASGRRTAQ